MPQIVTSSQPDMDSYKIGPWSAIRSFCGFAKGLSPSRHLVLGET